MANVKPADVSALVNGSDLTCPARRMGVEVGVQDVNKHQRPSADGDASF